MFRAFIGVAAGTTPMNTMPVVRYEKMGLLMQIMTVVAGIFLIFVSENAVHRKHMSELKGFMWMILGLTLAILGLIPGLVGVLASFFEIKWPPAIVVYAAIILGFNLIFTHSTETTVLRKQLMELSMKLSMAEFEDEGGFCKDKGADAKSRKDVLLVMPAYNEEKNIGEILKTLKSSELSKIVDILVIDDGSADNTSMVVREYGVHVMRQPFNMGYGAALQTGYKFAVNHDYKYLLQMDSDGQHDVCNLKCLLDKLGYFEKNASGKPDIVIGSRFLSGAVSFYISSIKRVVIAGFKGLIYHYTGYRLTDPTSGLWGMNRAAFSFFAEYDNFNLDYPDINIILQALLNEYKIEEIPAVMHARVAGTSMHSGIRSALKYAVVMVLSTITVLKKYRRKKVGERKQSEN